MIKIHTGNCSICNGPIFLEFKPDAIGGDNTPHYVFQGSSFYGEIGSVIRSCKCKLWVSEVPMDDPETDDLEHDARREEEPDDG